MTTRAATTDAGGAPRAAVIIRAFAPNDAMACCWIINENVAVMTGLNAAARRTVISKNVPERLGVELARAHAVVAVDGEDVVGVAALTGNELVRFHVARSHQGRGIGGALLMALEAQARRNGIGRLELLSSLSAESFYAAHGYVSLGEDRASSGAAEFVNVKMHKDL